MTDLAALTADDFEPLVGDVFGRPLEDAPPFELVLVAVDRRPSTGAGRAPFALLLRGPGEPVLASGVHPLVHPDLGRLDVLVSPVIVAPHESSSTSYEVVFG